MNEWEKLMDERFGCDNIIALATCDNSRPHVRNVNAFYENGSFYIITYALSDKMKQLQNNPNAAVAGEWFTGHGIAENLGFIGNEENRITADKLRAVFCEWIENGHVDFNDKNTVILRIRLTDGVLFSNGNRFDITF